MTLTILGLKINFRGSLFYNTLSFYYMWRVSTDKVKRKTNNNGVLKMRVLHFKRLKKYQFEV